METRNIFLTLIGINYSGWIFRSNNIRGYDESQTYNSTQNQNALNNAISKLRWYDIGLNLVAPSASIIYNILSQNSKY